MAQQDRVRKSKQGVFSVISVTDAIAGDVASELRKVVTESFAEGYVKIILDLNSVPFIDSKSLEILSEIQKESQKNGGGMKVANPSDICRDIFYATRLSSSLEIYSDVENAKRSFL